MRNYNAMSPCIVCGTSVEMSEPDRGGMYDDKDRVWCDPCAAKALARVRIPQRKKTESK